MKSLALNDFSPAATIRKTSLLTRVKNQKFLFLLFLPGLIYFLVFKYAPLYGILLAFKNFDPDKGILLSPWVGLDNFKRLFQLPQSQRVIYNTLKISILKIIFSFPAPILFALFLNEIRAARFKKLVQTVSYLPHFLSWVVVAGLVRNVLSPSVGLYGYVCSLLGVTPGVPMSDPNAFVPMLIISGIWKDVGWGSVIYLASIAGIGTEMYEAAIIDGAGRFKQAIYITLPSILPIVSIMFILGLGNILDAGFDQVFNLYSPVVYPVGDILDTYIYRVGLGDFEYSFSTAVGLFKSGISFVLVMVCNWIVSKFSDYSIW